MILINPGLGAVGEVGGGLEGRVAQAGEAAVQRSVCGVQVEEKLIGWKMNLTFFLLQIHSSLDEHVWRKHTF